MNPRDPFPQFDRRTFFRHGTASALALTAAGKLAGARLHAAAREPFAYDVSKYRNVDPALVRYEPVARFRCPKPEARRVSLGPDGRVYVAASKHICVLSPEGSPLAEIGCPVAARAVAVGHDGRLFAALQNHVEVFDAQGRPLAVWDVPKGRPFLTAIAVGSKDVFVADSGNRVVHRYDLEGKPLRRIGEKDAARNIPGIILPSPFLDVELGPDGLLRVNNPGRHRVELYTPDGDLERWWGRPSIAIDGFCGCCNPVGLALLKDGRCVTFEKGLPRAKVYDAEGKFECVVAPPDFFKDTGTEESVMAAEQTSHGGLDGAADAQGRVFILELASGLIHVLKPKQA